LTIAALCETSHTLSVISTTRSSPGRCSGVAALEDYAKVIGGPPPACIG
jgi:hypothetical protein